MKGDGYASGYGQALADVRRQLREAARLASSSGVRSHELGIAHALAIVRGLKRRNA